MTFLQKLGEAMATVGVLLLVVFLVGFLIQSSITTGANAFADQVMKRSADLPAISVQCRSVEQDGVTTTTCTWSLGQ